MGIKRKCKMRRKEKIFAVKGTLQKKTNAWLSESNLWVILTSSCLFLFWKKRIGTVILVPIFYVKDKSKCVWIDGSCCYQLMCNVF